ncbi:MAG: carboxypeptidase regulatory-like domain-containing protein [Vicinamibacterales bacterium]
MRRRLPQQAEPAGTAIDPASTGTITGRVRFQGEVPPEQLVRIDADRDCVALNGADRQPADTIVPGDDGTLQNVFVYISDGLERRAFPVPSEPVVIDQQKCRYVPRVVGVRVGQPLQIRNGDPLLHNVRSDSQINQPFNQGQPVQGMAFTHTFTTREVMVPIRCDVHAWMRAWVGALDHPFFAVTGQSGSFSLSGVPEGTYTVEAWHERLGTQSLPVTMHAGDTNDVVFTFTR